MSTYDSIESIGEDFHKAAQVETDALFIQGGIVKRAVEQGFDVDEVAGYCAGVVMKTKRTIYRYYTVSRTFGGQQFGLPFEMHAIAADTIDYRKTMSADELAKAQADALEWLKVAKREGYSTRALTAAIKASGGRVEERPTVLLDGVEAQLMDGGFDGVIRLYIVDGIPCDLIPGAFVKVTLLLAPTQASV